MVKNRQGTKKKTKKKTHKTQRRGRVETRKSINSYLRLGMTEQNEMWQCFVKCECIKTVLYCVCVCVCIWVHLNLTRSELEVEWGHPGGVVRGVCCWSNCGWIWTCRCTRCRSSHDNKTKLYFPDIKLLNQRSLFILLSPSMVRVKTLSLRRIQNEIQKAVLLTSVSSTWRLLT